MSLLHCLAAYGRGNLTGVQASQRDFSPFLAHFTNWSKMAKLRAVVKDRRSADEVAQLFEDADASSAETAKAILLSNHLVARSPAEKEDGLLPCICLSECTLPGLMSHSERFGRFGFVFPKTAIFEAGGRPCLYVGDDEHRALAARGKGKPATDLDGRLYALSNVYRPARKGSKVQDFTHEREWRIFTDIEFAKTPIDAIIAPRRYTAEMQKLAAGVPVIPLDTLFEWGA